jgi:hypothetical protein
MRDGEVIASGPLRGRVLRKRASASPQGAVTKPDFRSAKGAMPAKTLLG